MPKVSVIIPVYNVENYLAECLDSVLGQTVQDLEILCINDASIDSSPVIMQEYADKDSRIRVLQNNRNQGLAYTRNRGLEAATGEYILFVDSDDFIDRELIETVITKIGDAEVACFDYRKRNEIEEEKDRHLFEVKAGSYEAGEFFTTAMRLNSIIYSAWSKMYKRDFLVRENLKFTDGILYEDIVFNFLCLMKAEKVSCVPEKLYTYRYRSESIMTKKIGNKNVRDYFSNLCCLCRFYMEEDSDIRLEKAIEKYIQKVYRDFINAYRVYALADDGYALKEEFGNKKEAKLYGIVAGIESYTGEVQTRIADSIERIREAERIIVYGAGNIAREVLVTLDRYDVAVEGIAVSGTVGQKKSLLGNRVRTITAYSEQKDESLVVIATTAKFYTDIEKNLLQLGFLHYLEVF